MSKLQGFEDKKCTYAIPEFVFDFMPVGCSKDLFDDDGDDNRNDDHNDDYDMSNMYGCYTSPVMQNHNCQCHPSCKACGYYK